MKKILFIIVFLIGLIPISHGLTQECPLIGAIRWDAWHGEKGNVGIHEEKVLTPEKWHYRLPFCSKILNGLVKIDCANEEAMTKEIDYAVEAKLDYWAFVTYEQESPMSLQLKEFLKNAKGHEIKFALILEFARWGPKNYIERNNYLADLIRANNYLKINGRPVIFIFNISKWEDRLYRVWGGAEKFKSLVIDDLISKIDPSNKIRPYFIVMEFKPEKAAHWANVFGFDAISTYATHPGNKGTYRDLIEHTMKYWEEAKKTGKTVVPVVMAGWDPRPRAELPAPWQTDKYIENAKKVYFDNADPEQVGDFIRKAIKWAKDSRSPAIIIYAWNEFSEGGWIMPTLGDGDKRIRAIKKVVTEECRK